MSRSLSPTRSHCGNRPLTVFWDDSRTSSSATGKPLARPEMTNNERSDPCLILLVVAAGIGSASTGATMWRSGFEVAEALLAMPLGGSSLAGVAGALIALFKSKNGDGDGTRA